MARKELAARKEIYRQLCERERKNQMRCNECAEQLRADGNDVAQYVARFPSSLFSFVSSFALASVSAHCAVPGTTRRSTSR